MSIIWADLRCVGVGLVARNGNGTFLATKCKRLAVSADPASAEALAAFHATEFARERGYRKVCFEGDAQAVINVISGAGEYFGVFGYIVNDIRRVLGSFRSYSWSFVRRSSNDVAHCLAKHATSVSNSEVWMEEAPIFLLPPLQHDLNS